MEEVRRVTVVDRVRELVEPALDEEGLELFDVEFAGGRLAVLADCAGGVDLDALTRATQRISALLDASDPIPGRYVLEVSSPGVERPLRTPRHFAQAIGEVVSVRTHPEVEGERRCQGVLTDADADGFSIGDRRFTYADVERARTVFEWGPASRSRPGANPGERGRRPARGEKAATT